jgi:hypothetical protein
LHVSVIERQKPSPENNSDSDQDSLELASSSASSTSDPLARKIALRELCEQLDHLDWQHEKVRLEGHEAHDEAMRNQLKNYDQCLARVKKAHREGMVEIEANYTKLLYEEGTGVDRSLHSSETRLPSGTSSDISANQGRSPSATENTDSNECGNTRVDISPTSSGFSTYNSDNQRQDCV